MKRNMLAGTLAGVLAMGGMAQAGDFPMESSVMIGDVPTVRSVEEFREPLAEHGTWYQVESYGRVWQPDVVRVEHGWRPYCHGGNWVWTDRGWFWSSTYAWGWAPFHYGRWASLENLGWVWVPDVTWGPAWVEWRTSDDYVGWAPSCPVVSRSVSVSYSSGNVSYSYTISEDHYAYVPAPRFVEVQVVTYVVPYRGEHPYSCEPPRRHGHRGDGDRDGRSHGRYETPRSEPRVSQAPRYVNVDSGRRPDRVQQQYGPSPQAPARTPPAVTRTVPDVRVQGYGSRSDAPVRSPAPVQSAGVARKPVTEMMAKRNISPEQLRAALAKAETSPRYARIAEVVKQRWAEEQ